MSITTDFTIRPIDGHVGIHAVIKKGNRLTYSFFIIFAALFALNEMAGLQLTTKVYNYTFFKFIQGI